MVESTSLHVTERLRPSAAIQMWMAATLQAEGLDEAAACGMATILVHTSLRGIDTHGVVRLPTYIRQLRSGELNPQASLSFTRIGSIHRLDAQLAPGQVALPVAIDALAPVARSEGMAVCFLRRCGHLGALGMFALKAAKEGLVCLVMQQTPPIIALPGSKGPALGNNPLAFGFPTAQRPVIFDTSMSVVARGKLFAAIRAGEREIPANWAIDDDGHPTSNPEKALMGAMLPLAGYKGMGLAMLVEILAGSLAGATVPCADPVGSASNNGAFLLLLDPTATGAVGYHQHVAEWTRHYLAVNPPARLPGWRGHAVEDQRRRDGIPIQDSFIAECRALGLNVELLMAG